MGPVFLTQPIFRDPDIGAAFDDAAFVAAMVRVEVALAKVQAELGVVPDSAAREIAELDKQPVVDFEALKDGVAGAGVPVPALLVLLRKTLSADAANWLHYGATSQDIVDTAMCLCAKNGLLRIADMLTSLIDHLAMESNEHRSTIMLGRTRGQIATPITYGLRVAQWAQPLIALEKELPAVESAALRVQFGGAAGSQSVLGGKGLPVARGLAAATGLEPSPPWHTDRNGFRLLGGWLSRLSQALAKIGADVALSVRGEIAELTLGTAGGSSTMPQKANPVRAEALQAVATYVTACETALSNAAIHVEERDGVNWSVEWIVLPALFEAAGAALTHAAALLNDISPRPERMSQLVQDHPAAMSEAVVFALAGKLGRSEATRIVKNALADNIALPDVLTSHLGPDGSACLRPAVFTEPAAAVAAAIFAARKA